MTVPLLAVSALRVTFPGGVRAVRGVDFTLARGEAVAVVGASGAGKSATASAIVGLLPAAVRTTGSVRLRGRELLGLDDRSLAAVRGGDIALIGQDLAFTPVYRLGAQVAEALRLHTEVPRRAAAEHAVEALAFAGIPDAPRVARAYPHELSGGLLRRAMIAMAVAAGPAVILADEPTAGLDSLVQAHVLNALRTTRRHTGAALLLITHDLTVAATHADRVLVLHEGRVVEEGPVNETFAHPRTSPTAALLASAAGLGLRFPLASQAPGSAHEAPPAGAGEPPAGGLPRPPAEQPTPSAEEERDDPSPTPAEARRRECPAADDGERSAPRPLDPSVACAAAEPAHRLHTAGRPLVLEVEELVHHYPLVRGPLRRRAGVVRAVDGVRLDVRAGETLGLVGESGCGKTTLLMEIVRLGTCQGGRITVFGEDTATLSASARRRLRRDVQLVFQDPLAALDPRMTVRASLAEPLRAHREPDIALRVPELLRLVGLSPEHASRYPGELSGGQRQRVGIARALALRPRLLLLDEPFSALDVSARAAVLALLRDLRARLGLSYLLAAHDLAAVRRLADRIAVMCHGRIAELGPAETVFQAPAHPYTRALLSAAFGERADEPPDNGRGGRLGGQPGDPPSRPAHGWPDGPLTRPFAGPRAEPPSGLIGGRTDDLPNRPSAGRRTEPPGGPGQGRPDGLPTGPFAGPPIGPPGGPYGEAFGDLTAGLSGVPIDQADGCRFRTRCPAFAALAAADQRRCVVEAPAIRPLGPDRAVACHFPLRSPS